MKASYKKIPPKIYNYQLWISECNPSVLKQTFEDKLKASNFTIVSFSEHYFEKNGYTCFWLLAESHLALHTFPESNTTYLELSSCNKEKLEQFKQLL